MLSESFKSLNPIVFAFPQSTHQQTKLPFLASLLWICLRITSIIFWNLLSLAFGLTNKR